MLRPFAHRGNDFKFQNSNYRSSIDFGTRVCNSLYPADQLGIHIQ